MHAELNQSRWRIAATARADVTDNGLCVLDTKAGTMHRTNTVGGRIWSLIERGHTLPAITKMICEETGTLEGEVQLDVRQFLVELLSRGLIEPDQGGEP